MKKIVECVPNFSEGRDKAVIDAIVQAMQDAANVSLLDLHSDEDHNRTVVTMVGDPENVAAAAFAGISEAADRIDMEQHEGEHPRMGAADVVPFIPIAGVSLEDCVELATQLGQRVGSELDIPVYLYEAAATRPERENLAAVRKGQYEGLKESIGSDPERAPDFGPARLGSAGAVIIGARQPLIAYNVYLTTDDVEIAKKIALAVRHSSGGLHFVKGAGLLVQGRAQVSMNLTHYRKTPIARVVELIRREAQRYGVAVHHSELVGLAPQEALLDAAQWYLQLDEFDGDQILENRLAALESGGSAEDDFLDRLAQGTPTPGGGAAAARVGATAAALVAMVAKLTIGKKKYSEVEAQMISLAEEADELQTWFLEAAERDSAAFDAVMKAIRMPKENDVQIKKRAAALAEATVGATEVPLEVAAQALQVMTLALQAVEMGNLSAASDAGSAAFMAQACLQSAGLNVRINADGAQDSRAAAAWAASFESTQDQAAEIQEKVRQALAERAHLKL